MNMRFPISGLIRTVGVIALVGTSLTIGAPTAQAKSCYKVVGAKFLNVRVKARKSSAVVTSIRGGRVVRKAGLPTCGIWWCKVNTGKHVGYAGSKFLRKTSCP